MRDAFYKSVLVAALASALSASAERLLTTDDLRADLVSQPAGTGKLLSGVALPGGVAASKLPGDFLGSARWLVQIPVVVNEKGTKLVFRPRSINDLVGEDCQTGSSTCVVKLVIEEQQQCEDFLAVGSGLKTEPYQLCVVVKDEALSVVGSTSGPFQHRQPYGFWSQVGFGLVTQKINNPSQSDAFFNTNQVATRLGAGAWWRGIIGEVHYRRTILNLSSGKFEPRWLQGNLGYGFDLPKFWILTPHIELIGGIESYDNALKAGEGRFISGYTSPSVGFRSRFIVKTRLEVGGDFFYTFGGDSSKMFIQGDTRYWLTKDWAIGAGYWVDTASVVSPTAGNFRETTFALESYVRYTF